MENFFPNYTVYSLRIDCSHNEHNETEIQKLLDTYGIEHYLFGRELGDKLKKPHYQGIVWKKEIMEKKALNLFRATIKNKICDLPDKYYPGVKRQMFSFKKANKYNNLASYCSKDGDIFSNLDTEKRALIKDWVPKEEYSEKNAYAKKKALVKKIEELDCKYRYDWLHAVIQIYLEVMGTLPRAATLEYYQYKYWLTDTEKKALWLEKKYQYVFGYAKEEKQSGTGVTGESDDEEEEYTEKKELVTHYYAPDNPYAL